MRKYLNVESGFSLAEELLMLAVVGIIGITGYYIYHSQHAVSKKPSPISSSTTVSKSTKKQVSNSQSTTSSNSNSQSTSSSQQSTPVTFSFVPMTGWAQRSPTDKSFTVSFGASESYGYCSDGTGILLISMIYMNSNNMYSCGGIQNIVSPQTGSIPLYTQVGIGPSEQLWDKSGAQPVTVTLPQGENALRYDYTDTLNGDSFETIEYDITYQSKSYVAVDHWDTSKYPNGPNISVGYFDTIIQKTLVFN